MDYTIGITTFSKRYELLVTLIKQIRVFTDKTIIISVNGEKDGNFDEEYRTKVLELCTKTKNVFPTFFIETRGLAKMWNTILVMSNTEHVLMFNDDIEIKSSHIFDTTYAHINSGSFTGLSRMNSSFSHFIVSKDLMDRVGYFDERLLGFGEEDGDITYRLLKIGININNIRTSDVVNIVSNIRHEHIKAGVGKYSSFNRTFVYSEKYAPSVTSTLKGMFDSPMDQLLPDINQYPTEKFFKDNKSKL